MIKIRRNLLTRRLDRVKLVKFSNEDLEYNKGNNGKLRAEFDSYAIGYVVGSENKLFVDAGDYMHHMYHYCDSLTSAMDGINKRYIDEDEVFAIHGEKLEDTCNIKTNNLDKLKVKLMKSGLCYNFMKK